ncbi:MAG: HypC/HybG/HupF family hydrogenase formation chaperone [Burkholderiales bacterium]
MCIGIPMRVVSVDGPVADCEGRGTQARLDLTLIEAVAPGDWILSFRGAALRRLTDEEAAQTNAALDALAAVLAGEPVEDAMFADLVNRTPTLPPHLRGEG